MGDVGENLKPYWRFKSLKARDLRFTVHVYVGGVELLRYLPLCGCAGGLRSHR